MEFVLLFVDVEILRIKFLFSIFRANSGFPGRRNWRIARLARKMRHGTVLDLFLDLFHNKVRKTE